MSITRLTPSGQLPAFLPEIFQTFRAGSVAAREEAGRQFLALGPQAHEAIPSLVRRVGHADKFTRLAAIELLALLGGPAVPALVECVRAGDPRDRKGACAALGMMGREGGPAVPALEELADDEHIGRWARRTLRALLRDREPGRRLPFLIGLAVVVSSALALLAFAGTSWVGSLLVRAFTTEEVLCASAVALLGGFLGVLLGASRWGKAGAVLVGVVFAGGGAVTGLLLGGILTHLVRPVVTALGG